MIHPLIWLRNSIHSGLRGTLVGNVFRELNARPARGTIHFVSATRLTEAEFWSDSLLGKSLMKWRDNADVQLHIHYSNTVGLPTLYNEMIRTTPRSHILVFLHDDVYLDDPDCLTKIRYSLGRFDVVGVAGNVRLLPTQPAWCFKEISAKGEFVWDTKFLSGAVRDGSTSIKKLDTYGPAPLECRVLDGLFLASRCASLRRAGITFDERFKFHFYDMDFCRSAGNAGLTMGTWPIELTHASGGLFGSSSWKDNYLFYLNKWNSSQRSSTSSKI